MTELKSEDGIDHDMKKSPLSDGNRIYNGTFDQGTQRMAFWHIENMEVSIPDVVIKEDGSEDYSREAKLLAKAEDARMYQNGILINGGKNYSVNMDILGEEGTEVLITLLGADTRNCYTSYTFTCDGNEEVVNTEHVFSVPEGVSDNEAEFAISIPENASVVIDNIRLCEIEE